MTPNFSRMVVYKWKKQINEEPNFWSNGRAKTNNTWKKISYIFVEWSFANERNKSMVTLNFGQMVVYK